MALRQILTIGDETLYKKCRKVELFDTRLHTLLDDMKETMYAAAGVGLAAIQIGILKRVVTIDTGEGLLELVNPEIIETRGSEEAAEGCLSVPGKQGNVVRPTYVKVRAQDRNGEFYEVDGEGLLARAFCHEIEHLDGHLYIEKATDIVDRNFEDEE
ncbi:MAG: peptide deformylase [Clostridia bacterium]|nr:peptide deformylase [Clostridia bacterium]